MNRQLADGADSTLALAREACAAGWFPPDDIVPLRAGRINDTYRITAGAPADTYVLQAVNLTVFTNATRLVRQLARVVAHLNTRAPGWVPELLPASDGSPYLRRELRVWRLWRFVPGETLEPDHCARPLLLARLRAAGFVFARTQVLLEDFPGRRLIPGIHHYHDLDFCLKRYDELAEQASSEWRERIERYREQPTVLKLHDGYMHGDCKPANLLFKPGSSEVAAVLDLDTVMWGNRALDFGDLVRSSVWQQEAFDVQLFEALFSGFLEGQQGAAQPIEPQLLLRAPEFVSFMLSLRYLNDHLCGDREFKVESRGDNLARAERQFQRTLALTEAREAMLGVVEEHGGTNR